MPRVSTIGVSPTDSAALSKVLVRGERAGPSKIPRAGCLVLSPRERRRRRMAAGTKDGCHHPTAPRCIQVWYWVYYRRLLGNSNPRPRPKERPSVPALRTNRSLVAIARSLASVQLCRTSSTTRPQKEQLRPALLLLRG